MNHCSHFPCWAFTQVINSVTLQWQLSITSATWLRTFFFHLTIIFLLDTGCSPHHHSHTRRQMLLAEHTPGGLPVVWRGAHCPAQRNILCTSTKWPILWWHPRQREIPKAFPEIHSGECNDKTDFYQLRDHTLCLVNCWCWRASAVGIPSAAPCLGRADPSQQQIPD